MNDDRKRELEELRAHAVRDSSHGVGDMQDYYSSNCVELIDELFAAESRSVDLTELAQALDAVDLAGQRNIGQLLIAARRLVASEPGIPT